MVWSPTSTINFYLNECITRSWCGQAAHLPAVANEHKFSPSRHHPLPPTHRLLHRRRHAGRGAGLPQPRPAGAVDRLRQRPGRTGGRGPGGAGAAAGRGGFAAVGGECADSGHPAHSSYLPSLGRTSHELPPRMRRLLHRAFDLLPHPRHARGQAGRGALRTAFGGKPLSPLWPPRAAGGLSPPAAERRDVRRQRGGGVGVAESDGAGD